MDNMPYLVAALAVIVATLYATAHFLKLAGQAGGAFGVLMGLGVTVLFGAALLLEAGYLLTLFTFWNS